MDPKGPLRLLPSMQCIERGPNAGSGPTTAPLRNNDVPTIIGASLRRVIAIGRIRAKPNEHRIGASRYCGPWCGCSGTQIEKDTLKPPHRPVCDPDVRTLTPKDVDGGPNRWDVSTQRGHTNTHKHRPARGLARVSWYSRGGYLKPLHRWRRALCKCSSIYSRSTVCCVVLPLHANVHRQLRRMEIAP